jgi:hypothetical protein
MINLVLMFHYGRCGSTVLSDLLGQQEKIFCLGEIFNYNTWLEDYSLENEVKNSILNRRVDGGKLTIEDAIRLIDGLMGEVGKNENITHIVFEIKQYDFDRGALDFRLDELIRALMHGYNLKIVLLERVNLFDRFLSERLASQTGVYHLTGETVNSSDARLYVEPGDLLGYIAANAIDYLKNRLIISNYDNLSLTYERDIFPNPCIGLYKVCNYLGVLVRGADVKYTRTTPKNRQNLILNYKDIQALLCDHNLNWMIDLRVA